MMKEGIIMESQFSRMELLLGEETLHILNHARVAVFGIGGVGGYVVEALARCGIGYFDLIDNDKVALSNLNRQIIATHSTIGQYKVEVMRERILDINPKADVVIHRCFFLPEQSEQFDFSKYSYIVDAIDTVTAKIELVMQAKKAGVPIISAMGAGNKLDPTRFEVTDIYKTKSCPLARVLRRELKKRNVEKLKVVYSTEEAKKPQLLDQNEKSRRITPGSVAFVPSVAGLIVAGEVVKDLCKNIDAFIK